MTILVVDDDPAMVELLRDILEFEGHRVIARRDRPEPIPAGLDRIVLDVMLPSGPAWEWIDDAARAVGGPGRVVLTTASGDPADGDRARAAGCAFLAKPFFPDDLVAALGASA